MVVIRHSHFLATLPVAKWMSTVNQWIMAVVFKHAST